MSERKTWLCEVDDDGILTFPEELLNLQGWKEGDDINFDILPDGTLILTKVTTDETENNQAELSSPNEC
jgi:bifunctional DNA-binding transcriptional regulator/antitoxin component of YhaV-PrlF toxin-antitoxin module